jgi:folate-dependent phosphoribosylglycinamide formyltransferase PurN
VTLRIGWFTTARGPGSRAMYEAVASAIGRGALDAEFAFVFCNRDPGEDPLTDSFLRLVEGHGHRLVTRSSVAYRRAVGGRLSRPGEPLPAWRLDYDRAVEEALAGYAFDVGVLAGYMLIFEREFVTRHVVLNLHPALPSGPAGTWREVIRHLIRTHATESGVMLHLAIPEVDAGPVVAFCRYPLDDAELAPLWTQLGAGAAGIDDAALEASPLFAAIRERGVRREAPLLVATLAEFASGRLRAEGGRVLDAAGAPAAPADVTAGVEAALEAAASPGAPGAQA